MRLAISDPGGQPDGIAADVRTDIPHPRVCATSGWAARSENPAGASRLSSTGSGSAAIWQEKGSMNEPNGNGPRQGWTPALG